jgi:hypothetical protein
VLNAPSLTVQVKKNCNGPKHVARKRKLKITENLWKVLLIQEIKCSAPKEKQPYFKILSQFEELLNIKIIFEKNLSAMKNIFTFFAAAVITSMLFASCTKCSTCSYSYKYLGNDTARSYPEQCGNKKELDNYRQKVNADASADNGATVTCTEN